MVFQIQHKDVQGGRQEARVEAMAIQVRGNAGLGQCGNEVVREK